MRSQANKLCGKKQQVVFYIDNAQCNSLHIDRSKIADPIITMRELQARNS